MKIIDELIKEQKRYLEILNTIDTTLKRSSEGILHCRKKSRSYQYYLNGHYLKKNQQKIIANLSNRDYCRTIRPYVAKREKYISLLVSSYENAECETAIEKLHPGKREFVKDFFASKEKAIKEWEEKQYTGLGFQEDDYSAYYTLKGERVRSKAEKIIADTLYNYGIPYRYEYPVNISVNGIMRCFYPDFYVLNPYTLEEWIVEHFGMMDDIEYVEKNMNKLNIYEQNGFLLGKNILIFHETSKRPLNVIVIEEYIKDYFLCA